MGTDVHSAVVIRESDRATRYPGIRVLWENPWTDRDYNLFWLLANARTDAPIPGLTPREPKGFPEWLPWAILHNYQRATDFHPTWFTADELAAALAEYEMVDDEFGKREAPAALLAVVAVLRVWQDVPGHTAVFVLWFDN